MELQVHIVFAPKYRRQVIYGKIRMDIGKMLRQFFVKHISIPVFYRDKIEIFSCFWYHIFNEACYSEQQ
jgi:REP element-mobilizing transposase RayT